uniref:Uncharacterized protein n=1 Tax=Pelagomonas calceolata TaxID=35677 RepID=A0A7S3ZUC1_9STRA|mmetsp:Transcript_21848/g.65316  ORF Transcript_21848/g.65316 Transcript_21848/m.65316 type:complete len:164 (+) Transcript_21848:167-658(+)
MDSRRAGGGNRMMTSTTLQTNDIWSKTIGHDPHAGDAEAAEDAAARERQEERARGVMELARLDAIKQGGSSRGDNFAQSLFWGLKRKAPPRGYEMAPVESSSSSGSSSDDDDDDAARAAKRRRADDEAARRRDERRERKRAKKARKKEKKKSKKEKKKKRSRK